MSLIKDQQNKKRKLTIHTNTPMVPLDQETMIDTLLFRHKELALYNTRVTMMETINVDSDDDGEEKTIASKPPPVEVK